MTDSDDRDEGVLVAKACADLRRQGRAGEAANILRMWLTEHPYDHPAQYQLSLALLSLGHFAEAWQHFEARLTLFPPPRLPYPLWMGQSVIGREILVLGERRIEEQRTFLPFVEALSERGARVTFICERPVFEGLGQAAYRALPMGEEVTFPDPAFWVPQALIGNRLGLKDARVMEWAKTC